MCTFNAQKTFVLNNLISSVYERSKNEFVSSCCSTIFHHFPSILTLNIKPWAHSTLQTLILNSFIDGEWGEEELPSGFPLTPGDRTTITVTLGEDAYDIYANGDQFHYSYTHRAHIREIRDVQWSTEGDHVEGILQTGRVSSLIL